MPDERRRRSAAPAAGRTPAAEPGAVHLRLAGVSKRFGHNPPAVDNISLDVPRGSFTTLLGPSGCGKTTTLRMIAGFYEPDSGDIYLGERRINEVPAHRRQTAMVFQDYALFPHMSLAENVAYGLKLGGLKGAALQERVGETLRYLGLSGLEDRSPNQLSGGQQQRVALARALVMNPEVLLLDEPLSNLDARLRVNIRNELISIQRELHLTMIYVTHDQEEALAMSDWVAVMNQGRLVQYGTPWEVYYHPRTAFMADFIGVVNLVKARVFGPAAGGLAVEVLGQRFEVPRPEPAPSVGQEVLLSVRPESLALASQPPDDRSLVALHGRVIRHTFLGHLMRYWVAVGEQEWVVDQPDPGAAALHQGEVYVLVNPRRAHVIAEPDQPTAPA
jgi:ABC-type Fe3+/spermidine/putrescine transport system ATPase subunit